MKINIKWWYQKDCIPKLMIMRLSVRERGDGAKMLNGESKRLNGKVQAGNSRLKEN